MCLLDSRRCDNFLGQNFCKLFLCHKFYVAYLGDRIGNFHNVANGSTLASCYHPLHKVAVIDTLTFDSILVSTLDRGIFGETIPSFQSMVNITGSKVYVFDDKITICANNAEPVSGVDSKVAIGI